MKAKSILLTVPLAVSALTVLTLPANAVCWSWKPCADMQGYGYGYGVQTESQSVLPPLPPDGSVPPGTAAAPGSTPGATAAPGAPEKLQPAGKPSATATAAPEAAPAKPKPKPKPVPAQATAAPPPAPASARMSSSAGQSRGLSRERHSNPGSQHASAFGRSHSSWTRW